MHAPRPKLALYGGAFNPPTVGHARTAERLLAAGFSRIIVMPCFGHSFGKSLASAADRLLMASECFRQLPEVRVSSFEIDLGMNGSTFELVEKLPLLTEYGTHDFYFAIGSDEANAIHRWRRHEELRARIPFVVVPREGELLGKSGVWSLQAPHIVIPRDEQRPPAMASTQVRLALANGEFEAAAKLLAPRVWEHIQARRLYPIHKDTPATLCP
jgi:nicotinate-nucleotide adenylyltransferase